MGSIHELLAMGQNTMGASKSLARVAGNNLANVNTPGFSRQMLDLRAAAVPGLGVQASGPQGIRDWYLSRSLLSKRGDFGYHDGRTTALSFVEPVINDLDGSGLSQAISGFGSALQELSANPSDLAQRTAAIGAAQELANQFAQTRRQLSEGARSALDSATSLTQEINAISQEIAELNHDIMAAQGGNSPPNELIDRRDALLQQLAEKADIDVVRHTDGSISAFVGGGRPLITKDSANRLAIDPPGIQVGQDTKVVLVGPSGLTSDMLRPVGGRLGGSVDAYQDSLLGAIRELDQTAFDFAQTFNAQHRVGFALDGTTDRDFFQSLTEVEGAADALAVSAELLADPALLAAGANPEELPGGTGNLLLLAGLAGDEAIAPDGKSLARRWESIVIAVSSDYRESELAGQSEQVAIGQLEELIAGVSGVSADEELLWLDRANQQFEAATRLIQVADEMTQSVLQLI
jgi:flagellar hook-associated protein 1 FlgK